MKNLLSAECAAETAAGMRREGKQLVFTNGCFDILHVGHVRYLQEAEKLGDSLIIGLNSDASVRRLKGDSRPVNNENDRAEMLLALSCVDYVVIFHEDTPYEIISKIVPGVLVKGGDWDVDEIVGADIVKKAGGRVLSLPFVEGRSTTGVISRILERGSK